MTAFGPHAAERPLVTGVEPAEAAAALVVVHGRGGGAEDIAGLASALGRSDLHVVAPRAAGHSWYPQSFMAPIAANEPGRSSGLSVLAGIVEALEESGLPAERTVLAGFSQGACLTLEFAAREPRRFGGIAGLTGGVIGSPGSLSGYEGSLAGTPVFLGSGDPDPHVPWVRVEETASILTRLGAVVETRRYPGRPHTVTPDEVAKLAELVDTAVG